MILKDPAINGAKNNFIAIIRKFNKYKVSRIIGIHKFGES
jgi:hypothetical protein